MPGRNETRLLVYDTERQLWHEEDTAAEENASGWAMCSTGRQLYQWDGVNLWATEPEREARPGHRRGKGESGTEGGL